MLKRNRMESSFNKILESFRIAKGDKNFTHTSRLEPRGNFYIGDREDIKKFYIELCKANERNELYGITEKPFEISPLRQDFDFRFHLDHGLKRVYTLNDIKKIHALYCEILKKSIHEDVFKSEMLICIISEKSKPRSEGGVIKDGLHLFFPYLHVDEWFMDTYMRENITKLIKRDKIWGFEKYMESVDKLVDPKIATKVWMMYGSVSSPNAEYYKVKCALNEHQQEITLIEAFPSFFKNNNNKKPPEFYLPILMSIRWKQRNIVKMNDVIEAKKNIVIHNKKNYRKKVLRLNRNETDILEDLKRIDGDIMDMLSDKRSDDWYDWMDVGWTLHSISQGYDKGLEMWIAFSKRSPKFKLGECEELWDKMDGRCGKGGQPKTLGTIFRMARLDNPDAYNQWRENNVECVIEESLKSPKPTHFRIARVLHKCYEDRFVCSKSKSDMWFEYRDNTWHYVDDGISIKRLLPTIIAQKYGAYLRKLSEEFDKAVNSQQNGLAKDIQDKMKKVWKITEFIENKQNISSCVDVAKTLFYKENFHKELNANCWLIGDKNGVYDLKNGKHRDGTPDDNISNQMGAEYIDYAWDDPEIVNAMDFFTKVFPNERIRTYFLKATSACMQAGNVNKKFYVWTNEKGNNGKSVMLRAMQLVFGDYFVTFDPNRFLKDTIKTAGGPMPDLKRIIGKRMGGVKELAKDRQLDIGFLKLITGMDSMYLRTLHDEGDDITPQLTVIIMANKPPTFPNDEATEDRACIMPFESVFADDAPEDQKEQLSQKRFPIDRNFSEKLPDMVNSIYWILLQYFKAYLIEGLIPPPEVVLDTQKYKTDCNIFMQFINDKIKKTGNVNDTIQIRNMKAEMKDWFEENYPSSKFKYGDRILKYELAKTPLGTIGPNNKWVGFTIKDDVEDNGEESMGLSSDDD